MKRPLINEMDRKILRERPESYTAAFMRLSLAGTHLKREINRTIEPIVIRLIKWTKKYV